MQWFFNLDKDGTVQLRARAEGADGMVGDAREEVREGEDFYGVSYAQLRDAASGVVDVKDGRGVIQAR